MKLAAYGLVVLTLISCGPMNPKPSGSVTTPKTSALTSNPDNYAAGSNEAFVFSVKPQTEVAGDESSGKPVIGKNEYVIRLVHASDLSPVSKETQVSISYTHLHEKIPAPTPFTASVVPQADGSYLATIYFQKSGTWNLDIHASEPGTSSNAQAGDAKEAAAAPSLSDDYSLSITL